MFVFKLTSNFQIFTIKNFFQILIYQIFASIGFDMFILFYATIIINVIVVGKTQFTILIINLKQLNSYLTEVSCKQRNQFLIYFEHYRKKSVNTLQHFSPFNRKYGQIFVIFLFVNLPINLYIAMSIILRHASLKGMTFLLINTLMQYFCLFSVHITLVNFTAWFYKPRHYLLSLSAENSNKKISSEIRSELRLSLWISMLQTTVNRRVGVTYGTINILVTLATFAKVRANFLFLN